MNDGNGLWVAHVILPERGVFLVGLPEGYDSPAGTRCLVNLDYGEDAGVVQVAAPYDSNVHGMRLPGFRLVRPLTDADRARIAANDELADAMCTTWLRIVRADGIEPTICHRRLSFGRTRLFIRFKCETVRPDLSHPNAEIRRLFNATVNAWQIGPRDEVAIGGALASCGRVCCCASWQMHYPQGLTVETARRLGVSASAQNGLCGRFKCCLAFEGISAGAK